MPRKTNTKEIYFSFKEVVTALRPLGLKVPAGCSVVGFSVPIKGKRESPIEDYELKVVVVKNG